MPGGRDTGQQVVHYLSATLTSQTPDLEAGVKLGELPDGAVLLRARSVCAAGFGSGRDLIVSLGGLVPVDVATLSVDAPKVADDQITGLFEALAAGRTAYVRLDGAPLARGLAAVILTYIPRVG